MGSKECKWKGVGSKLVKHGLKFKILLSLSGPHKDDGKSYPSNSHTILKK